MFGRWIRHRDPKLCAIGGRAFYLLYRFELTGEIDDYDFTDNKSWFNAKFYINSRKPDRTIRITDATYADSIKKACKKLKIFTKHFAHYGRAIASADLEMFQELDSKYIKVLGNWDPGTFEAVYSAKMPLQALRGAAGFGIEKGRHWSARQHCIPPDPLQEQIFPFVEDQLAAVRESSVDPKDLITALQFLTHLKQLRRVILQDAALLMADGRGDHPIFELNVFQSQEFLQFQTAILQHVQNAVDPRLSSVSQVLPGVLEQFAVVRTNQEIARVTEEEHHQETHSKLGNMEANMVSKSHFANVLQAGATAIMAGNGVPPAAASPAPMQSLRAVAPAVPESTSSFSVPKSFSSSKKIWKEWYGLGTHRATIPVGGIATFIADRNREFKKWKSKLPTGDGKRFSRMQQVVEGINMRMSRLKQTHEIVIANLDNAVEAGGTVSWSINKVCDELKRTKDVKKTRAASDGST
jgi:hypothetical protein